MNNASINSLTEEIKRILVHITMLRVINSEHPSIGTLGQQSLLLGEEKSAAIDKNKWLDHWVLDAQRKVALRCTDEQKVRLNAPATDPKRDEPFEFSFNTPIGLLGTAAGVTPTSGSLFDPQKMSQVGDKPQTGLAWYELKKPYPATPTSPAATVKATPATPSANAQADWRADLAEAERKFDAFMSSPISPLPASITTPIQTRQAPGLESTLLPPEAVQYLQGDRRNAGGPAKADNSPPDLFSVQNAVTDIIGGGIGQNVRQTVNDFAAGASTLGSSVSSFSRSILTGSASAVSATGISPTPIEVIKAEFEVNRARNAAEDQRLYEARSLGTYGKPEDLREFGYVLTGAPLVGATLNFAAQGAASIGSGVAAGWQALDNAGKLWNALTGSP